MKAASPAELFAGLRHSLFHGYASAVAPGARAAAGNGQELIGVVMELALDRGTCLVVGLCDGSASVYLSSGGGWIGGHGRPHIHAAAKALVATARPFVARLPRVEEYPLTPRGRVRFSMLTSTGVHAAEVVESDLANGRGELVPLFEAAHGIIAGFLRVEQREPNDESGYVNCLLTTLARGNATAITLTAGTPPPDPARLTADTIDLTWIAEIGFALDHLSTRRVIDMVLKMAGFRWFQLGRREGRIEVRLAAHGGGAFRDVAFRIRRRRRGGRVEVEVSPVPSAG